MTIDTNLRLDSGHVAHFQSIPWCAKLLADPSFTPTRTASREPKASTEDSFFAETLQTPRTIRGCLSLQRTPSPTTTATATPPIPEVRTLLDLGDGVNGYPGICHGGFVATLLDEVMGVLLTVNLDYGNSKRGEGEQRTLQSMTKWLRVEYRRPVPTPGVVLATARVERVEGRKTFVGATVEDGVGGVFAVGEAMFVEVRGRL